MKNQNENSSSAGQSNDNSTSKQPNRFLSSDETQPIESGRNSESSDIGTGAGSGKTSADSDQDATRISDGMRASSYGGDQQSMSYEPHAGDQVHLPSMFAAGLAPETKENLERLLTKSRAILLETKTYVQENPAEAAGLLACSGALLWALLGSKPGRRVVEYGAPHLSRYLATHFNQTFALQGRQLQ